MSNETAARQDVLIAKCVEVASTVLGEREAIIQIRRGEPTFGRNYTNHYKVDLLLQKLNISQVAHFP